MSAEDAIDRQHPAQVQALLESTQRLGSIVMLCIDKMDKMITRIESLEIEVQCLKEPVS